MITGLYISMVDQLVFTRVSTSRVMHASRFAVTVTRDVTDTCLGPSISGSFACLVESQIRKRYRVTLFL